VPSDMEQNSFKCEPTHQYVIVPIEVDHKPSYRYQSFRSVSFRQFDVADTAYEAERKLFLIDADED
jgi:hypothetical protein